jgi:hypothetical protein
MERYAGAVPEALENLLPEERHRGYKMLRLRVLADPDFRLEVNGVVGSDQEVCHFEPLSTQRPENTNKRDLRFRALLTESGPSASSWRGLREKAESCSDGATHLRHLRWCKG